MTKPEWGAKRICQSCSAPFYDLRRDPIICPKCGATFDPEAVLKSRRTRGADEPAAEKPKPKVEVSVVDAEPGDKDDVVAQDDAGDIGDDDGDILEDTSDLGDDDVSDVIDAPADQKDT